MKHAHPTRHPTTEQATQPDVAAVVQTGDQIADPIADRGFTLVEIVIAIVLVGILSAVAVMGIGSLTSKGNTAACTSSLDAAKAASVVHFASTGAYPTNLTQMTTSSPPSLTLPTGVTVAGGGMTTQGSTWTLTMTAGAPPTFACS